MEDPSINEIHEANRRHWDSTAAWWGKLRDKDGLWRRCIREPEVAFGGDALEAIREFLGNVAGKRACVIGSGDNYAAFALAGMGAVVTSTDISAKQLAIAKGRAAELGLDINFVATDATDLPTVVEERFDLVCSTNGFFVWIAEPRLVFSAVHEALRADGYYVLYDVHPFQRPWKDQTLPIEMQKSYFETGPFKSDGPPGGTYEFHWTVGDLVNPLLESGLVLRKIAETPAMDSRFWQGASYVPVCDEGLLDWRRNPRAGLPVWLTLVAQKPHMDRSETNAVPGAAKTPRDA